MIPASRKHAVDGRSRSSRGGAAAGITAAAPPPAFCFEAQSVKARLQCRRWRWPGSIRFHRCRGKRAPVDARMHVKLARLWRERVAQLHWTGIHFARASCLMLPNLAYRDSRRWRPAGITPPRPWPAICWPRSSLTVPRNPDWSDNQFGVRKRHVQARRELFLKANAIHPQTQDNHPR